MEALELDHLREVLSDLQTLLGLQGHFQSLTLATSGPALDSPDQLERLFGELLVEVLGLEVAGL
jgi:hypothetical protein